MRAIILSGQFKKDLKLARKRHLPEKEIFDVIRILAEDGVLPPDKHDHVLVGNFAGCRECHIRPDWLLIYRKQEDGVLGLLQLVRTGSHSDLF